MWAAVSIQQRQGRVSGLWTQLPKRERERKREKRREKERKREKKREKREKEIF